MNKGGKNNAKLPQGMKVEFRVWRDFKQTLLEFCSGEKRKEEK